MRSGVEGDRAGPAHRAGGRVTSDTRPAVASPAGSPGVQLGPGERATPGRGLGPAAGFGPGGRGPGMLIAGRSTEKAPDFGASRRRPLPPLAPQRPLPGTAPATALAGATPAGLRPTRARN